MQNLITEHLDTWTQAIETKSSAGRGSSNKFTLVGIKKIRELILEMAVRGLLVPQDPNDEPASVLLEKIAAEKAQLIKDGKIKKTKALPEISEDEQPFDLPTGWEWIRLADAGYNLGQKTPDKEFSYIDVSAINKEKGIIEEPTLLQSSDAPSRARKVVKKGTVIYSTVRPYLLNIAVVDKQFEPEPIASTAFAIIHPYQGLLADFIYRYLRTLTFIKYVESCQTGVAYPAINDKQFFSGIMIVPPAEEQKRIVAKADELMALCDQLEQQTLNSIEAHQTLVETLLNELVNPNNTANIEQAWSLVAENFDVLFTTEKSIDTLKQTILQLAVMGKLVPQNPNDEPASKLLEKIAAEKAQLIKDKKIRKVVSIKMSELLDLPNGWQYVHLQDITKVITCGIASTPKYHTSGKVFLSAKNVKPYKFMPEDHKFVDEETFIKITKNALPEKGDILLTRVGAGIGEAAIVDSDIEFAFYVSLTLVKPFLNLVNSEYLLHWINSPEGVKKSLDNIYGGGVSQGNLNVKQVRGFEIPLPPLAEQTRIVAKVNELMTLCDQLKTQLQTAQQTQTHLAQSIAQEALN